MPRASVSIIGGIQPRVLNQDLGQKHHDNGMAARFLLVMPPRVARRWSEKDVDPDVAERLKRTFERLYSLAFDYSASNEPVPRSVPLTAFAKELWIEFYNRNALEQTDADERSAATLAKVEGRTARLALVLEMTEWASADEVKDAPVVIGEKAMERAVRISTWFKREILRVHRVLAADANVAKTDLLLPRLRERFTEWFTARDVRRCQWAGLTTAEETDQFLTRLVKAGALRSRRQKSPKGGRSTVTYRVVASDGVESSTSVDRPGSDAAGTDETAKTAKTATTATTDETVGHHPVPTSGFGSFGSSGSSGSSGSAGGTALPGEGTGARPDQDGGGDAA